MKFQNRKSFFQVILVVIYCLVIVYSGKNLTFSVNPRPMVIQLCHDDEGLIVHLWVHYLIFFFYCCVTNWGLYLSFLCNTSRSFKLFIWQHTPDKMCRWVPEISRADTPQTTQHSMRLVCINESGATFSTWIFRSGYCAVYNSHGTLVTLFRVNFTLLSYYW